MAIKIGITGGIGSGKSVVSRLLEIMRIPVYIADVESKRLTNANPLIHKELCDLLGEEVFKNGELNKPLLASYLFGNPDHAKQINRIIHPKVKDDFHQWTTAHSDFPIIGLETAILIESGFVDEVDYVVMVYAPLELRISRAVKRDGSSRELIIRRIQSQMDDEDKLKQADFVIMNDDKTPLIPQVLELISLLSQNIDYLCPPKK